MALRTLTLKDKTRPTSRPTFITHQRPPEHRPGFDALFSELLEAWSRYEDLRVADAPIVQRIEARERLHSLRAAAAGHRAERA